MDLLKSAGDNILFTGVLSNNKLYDIVSQALALVLPTHYEGFGITTIGVFVSWGKCYYYRFTSITGGVFGTSGGFL